MEIKNNCPHCQQPLKFEDDQIGSMIVCPGCQREIQLYAPKHTAAKDNPASAYSSSSGTGKNLVENQLETIGVLYMIGGFIAAAVCVLGLAGAVMDNNTSQAITFAIYSAILAGQGIVVWVLFRGAAEIIRLLRALNRK